MFSESMQYAFEGGKAIKSLEKPIYGLIFFQKK